jgi:ketosteroid isomerase-like protein
VSQDNVEIVRRALEAWNRRDIAGVLAQCHGEIEWREREDVPEPTVHRGQAAMTARLAELDEVWSVLSLEPQEFVAAEDVVVAMVRVTSGGRVSGAGVEEHVAQAFRLRAGKIIEVREYGEKADALKAVGLEA